MNKATNSFYQNARLLGLKGGEELPVIRRQFKKLALKYHPDKGGSTAMF